MGNHCLSVEIENLRKDIRMRASTDSIMSIAWILVYLLPIIAGIVWMVVFIALLISTIISTFPYQPPGQPFTFDFGPFYASIALFYVVIILSSILYIILIYKLVKRRNAHFKRQLLLFDDIAAALKAIAAKKGTNVEVDLAYLNRTLKETRADETESEKSAMLWAILSTASPLGALYVWYFLMKDFYKHERREDGVWADMGRIMEKCEIKFEVSPRKVPLPERSFALYFILTLITAGFFGIYWLIVLLNDPNQHFEHHIKIEEPLLNTLQTAAA
jgi:hypothetical protein